MIRRFNYTGRRKIPTSRVRVRVREERGHRFFDAELRLEGLGLPPEGELFVEAFHRASYRRFSFGTVEAPRSPTDRELTGIPVLHPLFRLTVVLREKGLGRVIAAADRIVPEPSEPEEEGRVPLLFVEYRDFGDRVWSLELGDDWPRLWLNEKIEGIREAARSGPEFRALVYPEVLHRVLERILRGGEVDPEDPDDPENWPALWIRFACDVLGRPRPKPDERNDAATDWIEDAVAAFCARSRSRERFEQLLAERSG